MVDITYVTISPYKYTSKLPHFLTPSYILASPQSPPMNLLLFLLYFGEKEKYANSGDKMMSSEQLS